MLEVPSTLCLIVTLTWVCEACAAEGREPEDPEAHHRSGRVRLGDVRIGWRLEALLRDKTILRSGIIFW